LLSSKAGTAEKLKLKEQGLDWRWTGAFLSFEALQCNFLGGPGSGDKATAVWEDTSAAQIYCLGGGTQHNGNNNEVAQVLGNTATRGRRSFVYPG
jgi:hypothetical protein